VDQLDISLPTLTDILNSRQSFPTSNAFYDIQLAMDERIYLTQGSQMLGRINFPNERGTGCDFQQYAINLSPGTVSVGLPSHINDIVGSNNQGNGFSYTILDSCRGRVQFNASTTLAGSITWLWEFGDNTTSDLQDPLHVFSNPNDAYTVKLTITAAGSCGKIVRSRIIRPAGSNKPIADFTHQFVCDSTISGLPIPVLILQPRVSVLTGTSGMANLPTCPTRSTVTCWMEITLLTQDQYRESL
jgi:hypothetical protein